MAKFSKEVTLSAGTSPVGSITGYTALQTDKIVVSPAGASGSDRNVNLWVQWDGSSSDWIIHASSTSYAGTVHVIIVS